MAAEWQCVDCYETWTEDGSGAGFAKAMGHAANTSRAGKKHQIRGLLDLDSGEVVVEGLSRPAAERAGYVRPAAEKAKLKKQAAQDDGRPQGKVAGDALNPSVTSNYTGEVTGDIKGLDIHFPAYIGAYAAMGMRVFNDPDTGTLYSWNADGMAKFLIDFVTTAFERMVPFMLGIQQHELADRVMAQRVQALIEIVEGSDGVTAADLARELYERTQTPTVQEREG